MDFYKIDPTTCRVSMNKENFSKYSRRIELIMEIGYHIRCRMYYKNDDVVDYMVKDIKRIKSKPTCLDIQLMPDSDRCIEFVKSRPSEFTEYWKRPSNYSEEIEDE